jgi:L-malate glycosyltransferase
VRVDQLVPGFARADAIGSHVLRARTALRAAGFDSDIYGEVIDPRLGRAARPYRELSDRPDPDRLLLYHGSTASPMAEWLRAAAGSGQALALDYHNITPSKYFARWEPGIAATMRRAREELTALAAGTRFAMADSAYNAAELVPLGYGPAAVCPVLVDLGEYHAAPDRRTLSRLHRSRRAGGGRWLFVGRIAPNKCQHDVVAAFALYRRLADPRARLTLVGGPTSPRYLRAVQQMADALELGDSVELRHGLSFPQLLAYFRAADVFVCLSEHEGFCVPIVEAMELGLPVVAYASSAVTDTVQDGGVLLADKDPLVVAGAVDDLLTDGERRAAVVVAGRLRAAAFALEHTSKLFVETIEGWLAGPRT